VLAGWLRHVTFGRRPAQLPDGDATRPHVNLAFTYAGLAALELGERLLYEFPREFRDGAWERSRELDGGAGAREGWDHGLGKGHVLLVVHARDESAAQRQVETLLEQSREAGDPLRESAGQQAAGLLEEDGGDDVSCGNHFSREHFGFADGCSQPAIEGVHDDPAGNGVYTRVQPRGAVRQIVQDLALQPQQRRWRLIRPGEFLLGYRNEDGQLPDGPPAPLGPNGTFMVYRKLEQHVDVFNCHIEKEAQRLGMPERELRARILGRWPDGTPLALSPEREDRLISTNRRRANLFSYDDDLGGRRCPLGAHARRTNPRNGLPGGAEMTMRHRMIRRGMPYGPAGTGPPPEGGRGLIFIAYNASIKEGFETVQRFWCDDGRTFGLGPEPDYLLQTKRGDGTLSGMTVDHDPANPSRIDPPPGPFVSVRGCEYYFLPSRRGCTWLTRQ
jgi:Dyp-type peroxidase family